MKARTLLLCAVSCLFAAGEAAGVTRYVSFTGSVTPPYTNWSMATPSIEAALEESSDGDEIVIADGWYYRTNELVVAKGVTIRADNAGDAVLYGNGYGCGYRGVSLSHPDAALEGLRIQDFDATPGNGGAVLLTAAAEVRNCDLFQTYAATGGVVAIEPAAAGAVLLECYLHNGRADRGGNLYAPTAAVVDRCEITSGRANDIAPGIHGGAGLLLRNCVIAWNDGNDASALLAEGGVTLESCTLAENEIYGGSGHGVIVSTGGLELVNCILYHPVRYGGDEILNLGGSNTYAFTIATEPLPGDHNLAADPKFRDPDNGDLRLGPSSPGIDVGTNRAWMAAGDDLAGNDRIENGTVDLGAYETGLVCDFAGGPRSGVEPLAVVFTAEVYSAGVAITNLAWDFDGDEGTDRSGPGLYVVTNVYASGVYSVMLTVWDEWGGSEALNRVQYIRVGPPALFVSTTGSHTPPFTNWATAATNLQAAADLAAGGSVITVAAGTYESAQTIALRDGFTVVGEAGAQNTVLRHTGTSRCLEIGHPGCVVDGFTITGGTNTSGAGVSMTGGTLANCLVAGNHTPWSNGGGVYATGACRMVGCEIRDNTASSAAGLYLDGGCTVSNCLIAGNVAQYNAGGIQAQSGSNRIHGCSIVSNRAGQSGVGVLIYGPSRVTDCDISHNEMTGTSSGGGAYAYGGTVFSNCTINFNTAYYYGGIYLYQGELRHCDIVGNYASNNTGGAYLYEVNPAEFCRIVSNRTVSYAGGVAAFGNTLLRNCLIARNAAETQGGGLNSGTGVRVENCTITENHSGNIAGGVSSPGYGAFLNTVVYHNTAASNGPNYWNYDSPFYNWTNCCTAPLLPGEGNTDDPPYFRDRAAMDYRLKVSSACLDAGSNRAWMAGAVDLSGEPRLINGTVDIGAYEAQSVTGFAVAFLGVPTRAMVPVEASFTAEVFGGDPATTYFAWDFDGDGTPEVEGWGLDTATNTYPAAGLYTVSLTASNLAGEADTAVREDYIEVLAESYFYRYVAPGGSNTPPYDTWEKAAHDIQTAFNTAPSNGVIWISNGVYQVSGVSLTRGCTLRSVNGAAVTTLHGDGNNSALTLYGGIVEDLTITGARHAGIQVSGAGYHNLIRDCVVVSNVGAGISINTSDGWTTVSNCLIAFNDSWNYGAGIYLGGEARITGCTISNNHSDGRGGGIMVNNGTGMVEHCTIVHNVSGQEGGGLYLTGDYLVYACRIEGNQATNSGSNGRGGGVFVETYGGEVSHCVIVGNSGEGGGGAHIRTDRTIRNCLLYDNTARNYGGGMQLDGGRVESCTVVENHAVLDGGGIQGFGPVLNSIVYFNTAAGVRSNHYVGTGAMTNCCTAPDPGGPGNITADPMFMNPAGEDYRPGMNSPCINAGLNRPWMSAASDLQGLPRLADQTVDIGAYEYPYPRIRADFSGTPREGVVPVTVSFVAELEAYDPGDTWFAWDFDDDGSVDEQGWGRTAVTNVYATPGVFTVSLAISNDYAPAAVVEKAGYIRAEPSAVTTRYVSPSGSHTFPFTSWATASTNLRSAVGACGLFDVVMVTNGLYQDSVTITVSNYVTVAGVGSAEVAVIDHMEYGGSAVSLKPYTTLRNVTVMRGRGPTGGGVYAAEGARIESCIVVSNAGTTGLGVYLGPGASIRDSVIRNNITATGTSRGGGIYCAGGIVENCEITGSSVHEGGGIYMTGGEARGCEIYRNTVYWPGGSVGSRGGGIYFSGGGMAENCAIYGNLSFGMFREGAVYFDGGGTLRNSLVYGHTNTVGAGLYFNGGGLAENCTVVDNHASGLGDGAYCTNGGALLNSIVYGNDAGPDIATVGSGMTFDYVTAREILPGAANLTNHPLFVDALSRNYQLSPASLSKDSGTNQAWMAGAVDLAGNPRIIAGVVDRGAFETPFIADFLIDQPEGLAPHPAVFTSVTEGDPAQSYFAWDLDLDGGVDAEGWGVNVVTNLYVVPGRYSASLSVSNTLGDTASVTKVDCIYAAPPDLYVAPGGSHTFPFAGWATAATSIQSAVNAGLDGCTVWITNGIYALDAAVTVTKALTVRSLNGREVTVVDGQDAVRGFVVTDPGAELRGLTIRRGYVWNQNGGGVLATNGCLLTDCKVESNFAGSAGGGVYMGPGGVVSNCAVRANRIMGNYGIGIYAAGATVTDSEVLDNKSAGPDGYYGGGIYAVSSTIARCEIRGNTAYAHGGGVYADAGTVVSACLLAGNTNVHWQYGGGISLHGGSVIENSTVTGNRASWGGGGINVEHGDVSGCTVSFNRGGDPSGIRVVRGRVESCTLLGNQSSGIKLEGGSIRNSLITGNGRGVWIGPTGRVESCTIAGNEGDIAVGLYVPWGATGSMHNCILYGNEGSGGMAFNYGVEGTLTATYTCSEPALPGEGNFDAPPEFVDPYGDYRLRPGSPAQDAGVNEPWMAGARDLDGQDRIAGGAVDLGAYEAAAGSLEVNPIADLPVGPGPRTVWFTAHTRGANTAGLYYQWDFDGDGTNDLEGAGLSRVAWTYGELGWYDVSLTVSNAAGDVSSRHRANYVGIGPAVVHVAASGLHVAPFTNWVTAATNLAEALDAALDGSRVVLTNGTHLLDRAVTVDKAIVIEAFHGPGTATVDGGGVYRCFALRHPGAVLEDLTVANGYSASAGGGVYLVNGGTVRNCLIHGGSAVSGGGGAFLYYGGTLTGTVIRGNQSSDNGGGIYLYGGGLVTDCLVESNSATAGDGGGFHASMGSVVRSSTIRNNQSSRFGGGLVVSFSGRVEACEVVSNRCGFAQMGGGAFVNGHGTLARSRVAHNLAWNGSGGGAFVNDYGLVDSCVIHDNTAEVDGGGLAIQELAIVLHTTVAANHAAGEGGGIVNLAGNSDVANSICLLNTAGGADSNAHVNAGTLAWASSCTAPLPGGSGNIDLDPAFVNAAARDYRLTLGSPAVDTGLAPMTCGLDRAGIPRPLDGDNNGAANPDMGAHEFASPLADTDADGLNDEAEVYVHGCSPVLTDTDADGQTDAEEIVAGADPSDPEAYFGMSETDPAPAGGGVTLQWPGVTGRVYSVRTAGAVDGTWSNVPGCTDLDGVAGTMACTNPAPVAADAYYTVTVRMAE